MCMHSMFAEQGERQNRKKLHDGNLSCSLSLPLSLCMSLSLSLALSLCLHVLELLSMDSIMRER